MSERYVLGLDFGTESARALLVNAATGEETATAVASYGDGVIDRELPGTGQALPPDWALQNPLDYLAALEQCVPEALRAAGARPEDVIGIGSDFTACTVLPVDAKGDPLCADPAWAKEPHAWVKLWKHHGAQAQADRITELAETRGEPFLATYGGKISSEWLFPKVLQTLEEAPAVYDAAARFIEAGDWITLQLTGNRTRNACAAGYKAMWDEAFPSADFLKALDPRLENIVAEKLDGPIVPVGAPAGGLTKAMAARLGLAPDTPVAAGAIDAHVAVPACGVTGPGEMAMIMGTSLCHMLCASEKHLIPGVAGVVKDGILPGYFGYEAGQAAVGDIFNWYVTQCAPAEVRAAAEAAGRDVHAQLMEEAARQPVGAHGLIALDWWNGNRSVLVDAELSGLLLGMTLGTTPADIYRALLESTAFGTYAIIRQFESGGCAVKDLYACGGLPNKNPLLMQIFADVTGRAIKVAASEQTTALGAAMWGAVAAGPARGGYANIAGAAACMARLRDEAYAPDPGRHAAYQPLFDAYMRLHDYFGRGENPVMKTLKQIKRAAAR